MDLRKWLLIIQVLFRFECEAPTGKKVAIIGGGPGGLSAAYYLALMGHKVTIFEQRESSLAEC